MRLNQKSSNKKSQRIKKSPNTCCQFIVKLTQMMKQYPNNVKWSNNGQFICFQDLAVVENQVIPNFFRHRNMLSFIRQLNMYYFSKVDSDENDVIKFKHTVFKKGNQDNFYLINRRNKLRDQIISNIQRTYSETLTIIEKQTKISQQTKSLVRVAIDYNLIALKNLKKIKAAIEDLVEQTKSVRSKQVKHIQSKLKQDYLYRVHHLIQQQKNLELFVKDHLCRDLSTINNPNNYQIPIQVCHGSQQNLFSLQNRTIMDIEMIKVCNFHSDNSLINFKSYCSLQKNLDEQQQIKINNKDQQISLEQDLKNQNLQE